MKESRKEEKLERKREEEKKMQELETTSQKEKQKIVYVFLAVTLLISLVFFGLTIFFQEKNPLSLMTFLNRILLVLFTIFFVMFGMTSEKKKKSLLLGSSLLLFLFYLTGIPSSFGLVQNGAFMEDLRGKTLTEAISWAEENHITLKQTYEYSDMIKEYNIISQSVKVKENIEKGKTVTIAISEGPNPSKEIILPSMISWDTEQVLEFVEKNYLSDVEIEFTESDKVKNTVIEQSKKGSMKRDEHLKLIFSYGEKRESESIKLIDLTNKSKFEAILYLKQYGISYELTEDFSKEIKKGVVMMQDKKAGETIQIQKDTIKVTLSKGPKIKVPDFQKMTQKEITNWIIKNKLKLDLSDRYDESIKENQVIEANYQKGDIIGQGTVVKITLSKGNLMMPKVENFEQFKEWASKYGISYQESFEFSNEVPNGEVIRYSYKTGETIRNNDVVVVTISDGEKIEVPNLVGLKKSEIETTLKKLGLAYNFVYKASNSILKDKAMAQSISKGSEVSKGTTITITLSSGKKETESSSNTSTGNNGSGNNSPSSPTLPETPSCDTSQKTTIYIYDELLSENPSTTCANIKKAYPKVNFSCVYQKGTGLAQGLLVNSNQIDSKQFDHCNTVTLKISQN